MILSEFIIIVSRLIKSTTERRTRLRAVAMKWLNLKPGKWKLSMIAMLCRLTELFTAAKHIFQTEGLTPLLRRGFAFMAGCFFRYEAYYLYEIDISEVLKQSNEADILPDIQDFTLKIVSTNEQADELARGGLEFRSQFINAGERLDKGAIAFCIFVGQELANIGWVAMTQQAKDSVDGLPFKVDFSNNEACTGDTVTNPKYRNVGLMGYNYFKRLEFLRENGKLRDWATVAKSNVAAQRGIAKLNLKIYAEARCLKLMWWRLWKERPLTLIP